MLAALSFTFTSNTDAVLLCLSPSERDSFYATADVCLPCFSALSCCRSVFGVLTSAWVMYAPSLGTGLVRSAMSKHLLAKVRFARSVPLRFSHQHRCLCAFFVQRCCVRCWWSPADNWATIAKRVWHERALPTLGTHPVSLSTQACVTVANVLSMPSW